MYKGTGGSWGALRSGSHDLLRLLRPQSETNVLDLEPLKLELAA